MPRRLRAQSSRTAVLSLPAVDPQRVPSRLPIYVCAAAEIVLVLGGSIGSVPWTRLLESAICRRHHAASGGFEGVGLQTEGSVANLLRGVLSGIGPGAEMDEALCKGDAVQSEMAELMGLMSSFGVMPSMLTSTSTRWSVPRQHGFSIHNMR